ncbi:MAG: Eco57I restriction-modification methylase domain-containing protein [Brevinema sp.]
MPHNSKDYLKQLVDLFRDNIDRYKTMSYDEANTRADFIDKFFTLLGWDVLNNKGYSEDYREVVREDKVRVEGKTKAPDYSFRLDGNRKFFVEAKKPIVNIQEDRDPAYQVRRYGYSAGCSISILTDFEEFAIYDTRIKPHPLDSAKVARIFYCTYEEYEAEFDKLLAWLAPEGIRKGAFDQYIKADKKGTGTVDTDFLNTLSKWRLELAEAIAKKNKELDEIDLNYIVQKIMNRIVFLRFAEDRGTTEYGLLKRLLGIKKDFYSQLIIIFDEARTRYNSDLFASDDRLEIVLEDKVIKDIISNLYYPHCPYEFNVISIELLGTIYERFLGDIITLDRKGKAQVEQKPETRKAGGVYYTPSYIVKYIVHNTVGKLLEGKNPREIEAITIVDPACGSGSFLIGVYTYLLQWYLKQYQADKRYKKLLCAEGTKLILQEKKDILIRHIYGVDLDSQAVEVSKLSLLLKLMEDEGAMDSAGLSFTYLPNLEHNIKAGNSLVANDYLDTVEVNLFDKREQHKIKVFEWKDEFTEVFKKGGFDVVVGNPPWGANIDNIVLYLEKNYPYSTQSHKDSFKNFIEKGVKILKFNAYLGMIVPSTFMLQPRYKDIRSYIRENTQIQKLWNIGDGVFGRSVSAPCCVFIIQNTPLDDKHKIEMIDTTMVTDIESRLQILAQKNQNFISQIQFRNTPSEVFITPLSNMGQHFLTLSDILDFKDAGINYQRINIGLSEKGNSDLSKRLLYQGIIENTQDIEYWKGTDITAYYISRSTQRHVRPYISNSLSDNERVVLNKEYFSIAPKLIWRQTAPYLIATIDTKGVWFGRSIQSATIKEKYSYFSYYFILGIFNSKYYRNLYIQSTKEVGRVFPQVKFEKLKYLPIPNLDLNNKKDKTLHDELVSKVQLMLQLKKGDPPQHSNDTTKLQIEALDRQIDKIVYTLYQLTDEEIRIIEGS